MYEEKFVFCQITPPPVERAYLVNGPVELNLIVSEWNVRKYNMCRLVFTDAARSERESI